MKIRIKNKIEKRKIKYIGIILLALMGSLMFHVDRTANMDFNRYQTILDSLRISNISWFDYMINCNTETLRANAIMQYSYAFNTLMYFVAKSFKNNYIIVWISVLIDYSLIAYIAFDWKRNSKYKTNEMMLIVLACFSLLPFIHVNSGLRTATSACIMALAVYRYLFKMKNLVEFLLLTLLSVLFHPFSVFAIPIAIVVRVFNTKVVLFAVLIGCMFLSPIAEIFFKSGIPFLMIIGRKYLTYTSKTQFSAYRTFSYGGLISCVTIIIYYLLIYRKSRKTDNGKVMVGKEKIYLFIVCFSGLIIGNAGSYEMVCRNGYLLGALSPVFISMFYEKGHLLGRKRIELVFRVALAILFAFMSFQWVRYYYPYFFDSIMGFTAK